MMLPLAKDGAQIESNEPVETDAIMQSMKITADNAAIISFNLAEIMIKINGGNGTLGRLIQDSTIAENLNMTISNLRKSSKGLNENMNAAKENFLLKGYFNRKARAAVKATKDSLEIKTEGQEAIDNINK